MVSFLLERMDAMLQASPKDVALRTGVARLLLFAGRPAEALDAADQVLRETGGITSGQLHLVRGEIFMALRRSSEALGSLQAAAAAAPELGEAVLRRLQALDPS